VCGGSYSCSVILLLLRPTLLEERDAILHTEMVTLMKMIPSEERRETMT